MKIVKTMTIKTEILIHSTPDKVWDVFTDFENYPNWNPFIKSVKGEVKLYNKIKVKIRQSDTKEMGFKPKIKTLSVNKELSWLGHLWFPGLFDGEHKFELIDHKNGTTTFIQSETFKGLLVSLLKKQLENNTKKGFEEMNMKLKKMVEENMQYKHSSNKL